MLRHDRDAGCWPLLRSGGGRLAKRAKRRAAERRHLHRDRELIRREHGLDMDLGLGIFVGKRLDMGLGLVFVLGENNSSC